MSLTSPIHVGALVYISGPDGLHPATIARVMPTQILTDCGRRFRRELRSLRPGVGLGLTIVGREVGGPGCVAWLPCEYTIARYQHQCEQRAAERARRMGFTQEAES